MNLFNRPPKNLETDYESEIDINQMNVYAIERKNKFTTIISYVDGDEEENEFTFVCPLSKHNNYVTRFRTKLAIKQADNVKIKRDHEKACELPNEFDGTGGNGYQPIMEDSKQKHFSEM